MLTNDIINELKNIVTSENVLTNKEELYVYAQDATNTKELNTLPDVVVFVETTEQVQKIARLAYKNNIPLISRGAGTNLIGGCVAVDGGIILNFSKMNKILEINDENLTIRVQSGVVVNDINEEAEKYGLFYPPDPSNLKVSTIGGSIALNSGGAKSFKYGSTRNYVIELKVVLADGRLITVGSKTAKNSTGYNLLQLFVGSEGTLGIIVEALLKLVPKPESSSVMLVYFDTVKESINAVTSVLKNKLCPATLDFMDNKTLKTIEDFCPSGLLTQYAAALLIEVDGFECSLAYQQEKIAKICREQNAKEIKIANTKEDAEKIWTARRSAFGACAKLKPNVESGDIVVPREKISQLIEEIKKICESKNLLYAIVGHIGDGNIHPHILLDYNNNEECEHYKMAKDEIHKKAIELGGTLSGEHGIGLEKSGYMQFAIDDVTLEYMKKVKKLFDEKNILNPKKIFK
ncbi:MAG: FAD-binding protein [bacterium]|nr:FAD-binding protein [bacterium]